MNSRSTLSVFRSKIWWFVIPVACISIAASIFPHWRPIYWTTRSQLAATKTAIRTRGEPVAFRDLQARDESGYLIGDEAAEMLTRLGRMEFALEEIMQFSPPLSAENIELLQNELDGKREVMKRLAAFKPNGECRFRYDFNVASPMDTLLPLPDAVRDASDFWRAEFLVSLHNSDYDQAVIAIEEICDSSELLRREPFLVSQNSRIRIGHKAVDCLEELLGVIDLKVDQINAPDNRLSAMESSFRLADVVRAERASFLPR